MRSEDQTYLLLQVEKAHLAVPSAVVQEVLRMPAVAAVPNTPTKVRGVINLRGTVLPLVDLRVELGFRSLQEEEAEFQQILDQRAEDHKHWLAELETCVAENKEFTLGRDPHACGFGKWYDSYHADNDTITFGQYWRSFDSPHKRIHAVADVALELSRQGKHDEAMEVINKTRDGDLSQMLVLFASASKILREVSRELAIVFKQGQLAAAVSADKVDCVMQIDPASVEPLSADTIVAHSPLVTGVARLGNGSLCLMLDAQQMLHSMAA